MTTRYLQARNIIKKLKLIDAENGYKLPHRFNQYIMTFNDVSLKDLR